MNTKTEYFFKVFRKSGIGVSDIAEIMKISRKTIYTWRSGGNITDQLRLDLAYNYAKRLDKACELGILPLVNKMKRVERIPALRKIIADMASK